MGDQKCPKGKYLDATCNGTSNPECKTCPRHTFTDVENNMKECRACRECTSNSNLVMVKECEADKNTECKCKEGYYCKQTSDSHCDHCSPVSTCPPGKGVTRTYTFQKDTVCRVCPEGTYSDVDDYVSSCKNYTSCDDLGRNIEVPGTSKSDVVCGPIQTCKVTSCSWVLPASLWAGIVVTALIVFLVLFIMYWRNKHQSKRSEISLSPISPVLPPDILKYPADFDMEKCAECVKYKAENYTDMDSSIQYDGVMPMMSEKYSKSTAADGYTDSTHHSLYQSQPQESEWTDEL